MAHCEVWQGVGRRYGLEDSVKNHADALIVSRNYLCRSATNSVDVQSKNSYAAFCSYFLRCAADWRIVMEILKVESLSKIYGKDENAVVALNSVSFSVKKGEFVAIIGPSGSGKSTLLHILGGVDRPTGGKVFLDGQDVYAQKEEQLAIFRRRQMGLIYQFYNLIPILNVVENMTLPVLMDGRKVDEDYLNELLDVLGLQGKEKNLPNQLSGGQQQRVSIGRALMNSPAVMLADEPTGNLDSRNSREVIELLKTSNRKYNQTLIVITHDENIALQADRIIAIEDGRITRDEVIRS